MALLSRTQRALGHLGRRQGRATGVGRGRTRVYPGEGSSSLPKPEELGASGLCNQQLVTSPLPTGGSFGKNGPPPAPGHPPRVPQGARLGAQHLGERCRVPRLDLGLSTFRTAAQGCVPGCRQGVCLHPAQLGAEASQRGEPPPLPFGRPEPAPAPVAAAAVAGGCGERGARAGEARAARTGTRRSLRKRGGRSSEGRGGSAAWRRGSGIPGTWASGGGGGGVGGPGRAR